MSDSRYYIYAITTADRVGTISDATLGLEDQPIEIIRHERIAAIVSQFDAARIRPQRRSLAAHHGVLKALGAEGVLPMKFGMIAEDRDDLDAFLSEQAGVFADRLERFAGRVEMTLKVKWDVDNIFARFVERYPELREARDEMIAEGEDRDAQMEVGELFTTIIGSERASHAATVLECLEDAAVEILPNDPRADNEAVSVACLVDRESQMMFESAVETAAAQFDDEYLFEISGPHPPHSFAAGAAEAESQSA